MSEHQTRMAAYKLALKPATKLVLLGIISRVDWQTMSGSVSAKSVADVMALSERTVRRAMTELEELGLISRERAVASNGRNAASIITIKVGCQTDRVEGVNLSGGGCQSDRGEGDNLTGGGCQSDMIRGCHSVTTYNQPIIQPIDQPIDQPSEEPKPKPTPLDWSRPVLQSSTPITNRREYR